MRITNNQVKLIQLSNLGLLQPPKLSATKKDILGSIRQMGILQIDTINVIARSPYFVLWSRLGNYDQSWLEEIHAEGHLFEYWAHAASFIPIEDYPLFRPVMENGLHGWRNSDEWRAQHLDTIHHVMEIIKLNGPTRSSDFENSNAPSNGWWNWKDEKIAMESMWSRGDLMVSYRKKFQRYYDLTDRVHPNWKKNAILTLDESLKTLIEKSIKILGASRPKWVADYYRISKPKTEIFIDQLLSDKKIFKVESENWDDGILIHQTNNELLQKAINNQFNANYTTLLSPFDPMIWDRQRTMDLFNFEYTIECYLPKEKRKYGYFNLPILHNGELIGRLDAKAHRKEKIFEIRQLHFEDSFIPESTFSSVFMDSIQNCANWHSCPQLEFTSNQKPPFK